MNNKLIFADALDILSYVLLQNITTQEVLNWVYTSLLIVSLLLGIVIKVIAALKDRKITKEEAEEIKNAVDDAKAQIEDEIKKDKEDNK